MRTFSFVRFKEIFAKRKSICVFHFNRQLYWLAFHSFGKDFDFAMVRDGLVCSAFRCFFILPSTNQITARQNIFIFIDARAPSARMCVCVCVRTLIRACIRARIFNEKLMREIFVENLRIFFIDV